MVNLNNLRYIKEKLTSSDTTDAASFLMSKSSGHLNSDRSSISYQVIEETVSEQVIEVVETYHDGDNTIWSRYKATRSTITPFSSRMFYFGYVIGVLPYAIGFGLLLYVTGRVFRRRSQKLELVNDDS